MNDALPLGDPYRHVSTRDFFAPVVAWFHSVIQIGCENSIVLREQSRACLPAPPGTGQEQLLAAEFKAACHEAVTFAQQLKTGQVGHLSHDLIALARQAVQQCAAREKEDVQTWADRLARDVGNATD